jgi:alkylhydroperoxidase family enzyme
MMRKITMLRSFILNQIDAQERQVGGSMDYVRYILRNSLPSFFKFSMLMPLTQHREKLPASAYHVACIVATQDEDCGSCVQIQVNLAQQNWVSAGIVQAVLADRPEDLPIQLAIVYRFTKAVVKNGDTDQLREQIQKLYGEEALVELALAIASSRVFPITKRALGFATSCDRIKQISYISNQVVTATHQAP